MAGKGTRAWLLATSGDKPGTRLAVRSSVLFRPSMSIQSDPLRPHPLLEDYYGSEGERRRRVVAWFDKSAPDYDWVNHAVSFGSGSWYRREALLRAGLAAGMSALDV